MIPNLTFRKSRLNIFLKRFIYKKIKGFLIILKLESHIRKLIKYTNPKIIIKFKNTLNIYHLFILMDRLKKSFKDSFVLGEIKFTYFWCFKILSHIFIVITHSFIVISHSFIVLSHIFIVLSSIFIFCFDYL